MLVTRYHGVWSIVAAFSEAPVIAEVIADLRTVLDHVVCVDDGSHDDTAARALVTGAGTHVEKMTRIWDRSQMTYCETVGIIAGQSLVI